jgi:hypothetical protein
MTGKIAASVVPAFPSCTLCKSLHNAMHEKEDVHTKFVFLRTNYGCCRGVIVNKTLKSLNNIWSPAVLQIRDSVFFRAWIRNRCFPAPGSQPIFLVTVFLGKKCLKSLTIGSNYLNASSKPNKFKYFRGYKKGKNEFCPPSSFVAEYFQIKKRFCEKKLNHYGIAMLVRMTDITKGKLLL